MGDVEKKTQKDVVELREQLTSMSTDMRMFSLSMRSLYVQNAVGTSTEPAKKFRKLRDDTRNDAMVYLKGVLPLSTKFVASISEYFEYYEALDYNEWCEMLSDILIETVAYRELCETLVKMHEDILVPLKKRKDEAMIVAKELTELKAEFEKKKKELEEKANTKRSWAIGLAFIPFVGAIAGPVLAASADSDIADAVAKGGQAKVQEAAAIVVSEVLIPALESFIDGIRKAAGFFSVMEQELRKFESKAEKGKGDPKKLYYKVMQTEAKDMKSICQVFYAVLPDVRTDFLAIPSEGTDQNYIDRWLEKQKKTIRENCKGGPFANKLLKAITDGK
ncbi:hypothetical protein OS493_033684 [Desmophyllum pertusum]|uniref:Uncharacterized protein n=1 Tax=Desmophyllum pertusum TaxID=174260 RepID=A0A9W9ZKX8_9CNID|nr:hypothetical protein OS493_033684 [Desmophyllum pertusum]